MKRVISLILVLFTVTACFFGCNSSTPEDVTDSEKEITAAAEKVLFTMENGDTFTIELYPQFAPQTVENFLSLVKEGFYDGTPFHRVIDNFMAQGGDPDGDGIGGSEKKIYGEFYANGFTDNTLSHTRGIVSMARTDDPNSASSQFFICYSDDCTFLDGNYAAFGKVIDGMETVDKFLETERLPDQNGQPAFPTTPIIVDSARVIS